MKKLLIMALLAVLIVGSAQAATVFLEDFEGPPAPSGSTTLADDLGWTKFGAGVGYNTTVAALDTGAAYQPAANTYHVKAVGAGMIDDIITFKADLFADGLYDEAGGEGQVGIDDGTDGWVNAFVVGPAANPANPGYPGAGGGGWVAYDGLNDTGRINIMDGGAPGVGNRFLGGTNAAVTLKVVFDQLVNTISIDIIDRATQVSLIPTFVIPLTAGGKTELQACTGVAVHWADVHAPNPGLKEVDNISLVSVPEPATMILLGLGGLTLLRKRRS